MASHRCKRKASPPSKDTHVDFSDVKKVKREDTAGPTPGDVSSSSSSAVVVDVLVRRRSRQMPFSTGTAKQKRAVWCRVRFINATEEGCQFDVKEVDRNHKTTCNHCNQKNFFRGNLYAVCNAHKFYASCVMVRSDMLLNLTGKLRRYRASRKMQKQLEMIFSFLILTSHAGLFQKGPNESFRSDPRKH
jgi:hypothetical protein